MPEYNNSLEMLINPHRLPSQIFLQTKYKENFTLCINPWTADDITIIFSQDGEILELTLHCIDKIDLGFIENFDIIKVSKLMKLLEKYFNPNLEIKHIEKLILIIISEINFNRESKDLKNRRSEARKKNKIFKN